MAVYVLKNKRTTLERIDKFLSTIYFTDVNLRGRLYQEAVDVLAISHYDTPDRITYEQAIEHVFTSTQIGTAFGPAWSTHWFKLDIEVPEKWLGKEVRLCWNSGSEAMVWKEGIPCQGLTSDHRNDFILSHQLKTDELQLTLYIEMACNGLFGAPKEIFIGPPDPNKQYTLSQCQIAVFDRDVNNLIMDLQILHDMAKLLPEDNVRSYQALFTANDIINQCDVTDGQSLIRCHAMAEKLFNQRNGDSQHTIHAMGHCHIDSAWLWPYAETIRKCGRSWSSTVKLLTEYPNWKFTCSQAQQFEWVKEHYPAVYDKMKHYVKEGRFIPVGGTWVEMDGLIPSGESMIRQFLLGQRFFKEEFGVTCQEFWLPDTFGYSAQLPQIMQICGIKRFLSQKMSWNLVNKFPHNTFDWEGIDGSQVLCHFPPGDSYCMKGEIDELLKTVSNFKDKGRTNNSMFLFGYGDGGQGPTENMLEFINRLKDTDGLPKMKLSSPGEFFSYVENHETSNLCKWTGELYLELHNATYTTHAKTKLMNRKCEFLLRDVELASTIAWYQQKVSYPADELLKLWKLLLLNQFHDVLPGSCIQQVYKDAQKYYNDITTRGSVLLNKAVSSLYSAQSSNSSLNATAVLNTLSWKRTSVISVKSASLEKKTQHDVMTQLDVEGNTLVCVEVPEMGYAAVEPVLKVIRPVIIGKDERDGLIYIRNKHLQAVIDSRGHITSLCHMADSSQMRNLVSDGYSANQFVIFDDVPLFWDAWDVMDYHLETRKEVNDVIEHATIIEDGPLRASVKVVLKISDNSYLNQTISLDACSHYLTFHTEVTWHESHKFLKVEFPLAIRSTHATYDIQYGFIQRPTHMNTSWDWAKFEVCGHKWADMSEFNSGVAILNDCKYGWSARNNLLRLSLLRAPKAPDPKADMGIHQLTYALMPHAGSFQESGVIQAAYELNVPLIQHQQSTVSGIGLASHSYFTVDQPSVILDTVKKCEKSDGIILRLYEAYGGTVSATIATSLTVKQVIRCNALEEIYSDSLGEISIEDGTMKVTFSPFQIITLMLSVV